MAADQVLVGLNKSRRLYNTRLRELQGYRNPMPAAGEKLVCLRNDKTKGLLNGGTWSIQTLHGIRNDFIRMDVLPDGEVRGRSVEVSVHKAFFEGAEEDVPFAIRRESDEFTYGYALDGSQGAGVAMGRSGAFRRILCVPRAPESLALYGADPCGREGHGRPLGAENRT